jgi:hypothetical protein
MTTEWGEQLKPDNVLQEYPRPQLVRDSYVNLNGLWDYAITDRDNAPQQYDGKILVPFSPEAPLSGVNRTLQPGQTLWYRCALPVKPQPCRRLLLHFGACDQTAEIYVNQKKLGEHVGGYTSFTVDATGALAAENTLVVKAHDDTDENSLARGKQRRKRGGIWYTRQSGLWQTVWAEWVPEAYIKGLKITPDLDKSCVHITVQADKNMACYLLFAGKRTGGYTNRELTLSVDAPVLWTPENPKLYDFSAELGEDHVDSYFALRKISVGPDAAGKPRILLNNRPYYQNGLLDQGYWPDGLYTAPSDEALIYDIALAKRLGFNMLRKHMKLEPLRWYYHCDRLGMLVWQDMPSGGGQYDPFVITAPLFTGRSRRDDHYKAFARADAAGREQFQRELREMILQLYNCPCVVLWTPFNEGWGQFDAAKIAEKIESLDPTRLVDHASGWHDQKIGKLKSLHVYFRPYRFRPDKLGRAVALTEFGGYKLAVPEHVWGERNFGYRGCRTPEKLGAALRKLFETQIVPAREKGLSASVYTQLSDVEDECNGLVSYDRRVQKLPDEFWREISRGLSGEGRDE